MTVRESCRWGKRKEPVGRLEFFPPRRHLGGVFGAGATGAHAGDAHAGSSLDCRRVADHRRVDVDETNAGRSGAVACGPCGPPKQIRRTAPRKLDQVNSGSILTSRGGSILASVERFRRLVLTRSSKVRG